jgi:hypothetical protein
VQAVPRLCEFYPGICLTAEEKARKNHSQGKKNLSQVKKNFSHSTVYILPKNTHTLQNPHKHTHYKTHAYTPTRIHALQNSIKPPQCKLKRFAYRKSKSTQFIMLLIYRCNTPCMPYWHRIVRIWIITFRNLLDLLLWMTLHSRSVCVAYLLSLSWSSHPSRDVQSGAGVCAIGPPCTVRR